MKQALRKWTAFGVKKSKLFERSEFLDFSQKAVIFSLFHAALTFFVTFLCQDKKVRIYRNLENNLLHFVAITHETILDYTSIPSTTTIQAAPLEQNSQGNIAFY